MDAREDDGVLEMLTGLLDVSHLVAFRHIPLEANRYGRQAGIDDVEIFLADMEQRVLRKLVDPTKGDREAVTEHAVEGTMAGRAFQYGKPVLGTRNERGRQVWWVPLVKGTERLGVMRASTHDAGRVSRRKAELLSAMVALVIIARRRSSDVYPRTVRTRRMEVAAELEWQLMPPRTYADADVVISGLMEPAYTVGGDAFDYAIFGRRAHFAVFDSMGHDTRSGIAANLAVTTYRNCRRQDRSIVEASTEIDRVLVDLFGGDRYVTGVIGVLDTTDGELTWISRGHPAPILMRSRRWSAVLECRPAYPMGIGMESEPLVCHERLEPGDRVVCYTDGITEARDEQGREFGPERFIDFIVRHHSAELPTPETLRRLIGGILEYQGGRLGDDATVLMVEWLGPGPSRIRPEPLAGLPY